MRLYLKYIFSSIILIGVSSAFAQDVSRPDSHAPIGVMGDHTHKKGEFMFSYRFMSMPMEDNLVGSDDISTEEIATTISNRFSDVAGQPPTLRVVPENMTMNMHMIGAMYAPSDRLTLMGMTMVLSNSMDHTTYQGGMGTTILGGFTTESSGLGDTKITALYQLSDPLHVNIGISIPTGSIEEEDQVLAPTGMEPTLRLPYPMQLGSGTWDLLPALTYVNKGETFSWGGQLNAVLRLGENDNGFSYGNRMEITSWGSYLLNKWLSSSLRLSYSNLGAIDGIDPDIVAPVQTANPDFHGGSRLDGLVGLNMIGQSGFVKNQRLAVEFGIPLVQDLNGPQLQVSNMLTLGWQYAF